MNLQETDKVLTVAALYDQRRVGDEEVIAWHQQLRDFTYADCNQAVLDHYGQERERVWPADVVRRVKEIQTARSSAVSDYQVIRDVHPLSKGYLRLLQARRALIRHGATLDEAVAAVPADPAEEAAARALETRSLAELGTANPGGHS